jgi:hypothetical protein
MDRSFGWHYGMSVGNLFTLIRAVAMVAETLKGKSPAHNDVAGLEFAA